MKSIAARVTDVSERIADCEGRIAEQRRRLIDGTSSQVAMSALLIDIATATLRHLEAYKAGLKHRLRGG